MGNQPNKSKVKAEQQERQQFQSKMGKLQKKDSLISVNLNNYELRYSDEDMKKIKNLMNLSEDIKCKTEESNKSFENQKKYQKIYDQLDNNQDKNLNRTFQQQNGFKLKNFNKESKSKDKQQIQMQNSISFKVPLKTGDEESKVIKNLDISEFQYSKIYQDGNNISHKKNSMEMNNLNQEKKEKQNLQNYQQKKFFVKLKTGDDNEDINIKQTIAKIGFNDIEQDKQNNSELLERKNDLIQNGKENNIKNIYDINIKKFYNLRDRQIREYKAFLQKKSLIKHRNFIDTQKKKQLQQPIRQYKVGLKQDDEGEKQSAKMLLKKEQQLFNNQVHINKSHEINENTQNGNELQNLPNDFEMKEFKNKIKVSFSQKGSSLKNANEVQSNIFKIENNNNINYFSERNIDLKINNNSIKKEINNSQEIGLNKFHNRRIFSSDQKNFELGQCENNYSP